GGRVVRQRGPRAVRTNKAFGGRHPPRSGYQVISVIGTLKSENRNLERNQGRALFWFPARSTVEDIIERLSVLGPGRGLEASLTAFVTLIGVSPVFFRNARSTSPTATRSAPSPPPPAPPSGSSSPAPPPTAAQPARPPAPWRRTRRAAPWPHLPPAGRRWPSITPRPPPRPP